MEHSTQFTPVSHKKRGWTTRNAAGQSRSGSKFSTTYLHPGFRSETGQEGPTEQTVAVTTEKPWGLTGVPAAALANLAALQLGPRVVLVVLDQGEDRDRHGQPVSARSLSDARSLPVQYCMQLPLPSLGVDAVDWRVVQAECGLLGKPCSRRILRKASTNRAST